MACERARRGESPVEAVGGHGSSKQRVVRESSRTNLSIWGYVYSLTLCGKEVTGRDRQNDFAALTSESFGSRVISIVKSLFRWHVINRLPLLYYTHGFCEDQVPPRVLSEERQACVRSFANGIKRFCLHGSVSRRRL